MPTPVLFPRSAEERAAYIRGFQSGANLILGLTENGDPPSVVRDKLKGVLEVMQQSSDGAPQ